MLSGSNESHHGRVVNSATAHTLSLAEPTSPKRNRSLRTTLASSFFAVAPGQHIEGFDSSRKRDRKIDVAARDMKFESVRHQGNADQHQKCQRQHLGGRMLRHETCHRSGGHVHDDAGDYNSRDHDLEILRHADRGDNGIEREYHIDDDDLDDYPEKRAGPGRLAIFFVARFYLGVNFMSRLGDQKQPAADQNEVPPGKRHALYGEDGFRQAD